MPRLSSALCSLSQVKRLLAEGINRPRKGHDAGDHPPITPMRSATEAELGIRCTPLSQHTDTHSPHTLLKLLGVRGEDTIATQHHWT